MGAVTKEGAVVRTKRTWLLVASLIVMVLGFAPIIVLFVSASGPFGHVAGLLGIAAYYAATFGTMHAWNRWWLERKGTVRADEEGLWLDGVRIVARSAVRHGYVHRRNRDHFVRLGRAFRLVDVEVASEEDGAALIHALRLDAARSVGLFPMNHGTYRRAWLHAGTFLAIIFVTSIGGFFATARVDFLLGSMLLWAVVGWVWGSNQFVRVSVGADGVRLRRLLSRARFVPFGAIETATTDGQDVTLRLRDGDVIEIHHPAGRGWKPLLFSDRFDEGRKLVERINAQIVAHRGSGRHVEVLARGARETRQWLRDLSVASDEHSSFRAPAVPPDELWRVVEDPAAPPTVRAGAAVALRARVDDDGRARLRLVADACAEPRLRLALHAVATPAADDAIEEAFDDLREPELKRAARRA